MLQHWRGREDALTHQPQGVADAQLFARLVRDPALADSTLDVARKKQMPKQQLVLGNGVAGEHQRQRPLRNKIEAEEVVAAKPGGSWSS